MSAASTATTAPRPARKRTPRAAEASPGFAFKQPAPAAAIADPMPPHEAAVIEAAKAIIQARMTMPGQTLDRHALAADLVFLHLAGRDREHFAVIFLDAQSRLIAFDELFAGTLTQASVYPREIARRAMQHNAAAVILAHNHPSGNHSPSSADEMLTARIFEALRLLDVQVLDHLIVGATGVQSMACLGLL